MSSSQFATYPSLKNRAVLITGGATGIGESFVSEFARQGARVAFLDIQDEAANSLIAQLAGEGHHAPLYRRCDVTDLDALKTSIAELIGALGGVDVFINNAANDQRHSLAEVTPEFWEQSINLNLRSQFFAAQAVLPEMAKTGRGSVINMSSIAWMIPSTGMPCYVTAKAGIVGLTRTLAHEFGSKGVRVNAVLPGAIATERQKQLWYTPEYKAKIMESQSIKRDILPDDVARLVLFLAADDSSAITGQSHIVDGGWM